MIAGSSPVLQGTSKKVLPKKDIFALVLATGGSRRRPDEENEGSIPGPRQPRVRGTRWQRGGLLCLMGVLMGAAAGMRASIWVNFVPRRPVLFWVPRKQASRFRPGCSFMRMCSPGGRSGGQERGRPTLAARGNRPDIRRAVWGVIGGFIVGGLQPLDKS